LLKQHFGKYRSPVFIGSWSVIVFEIRGKWVREIRIIIQQLQKFESSQQKVDL
jgi:hypothetical protein